MGRRFDRYFLDMENLHSGFREQPCFVCRMVAGDVRSPEKMFYEENGSIVSLDGYSRVHGYTLVAPKGHREQVTADFALEEYLRLQALVYGVAEMVREEVGAERMYLHTFASSGWNAQVHWHVGSLPLGVPYEDQQGAWADWEEGVREIPQQEMSGPLGRVGRRQ